MGTKRLKMKDDLHYRKGPTSGGCSHCNFYVGNFQVRGLDGNELGLEPRCRVMGFENSNRYRINPDNHCDRYDGNVHLLRLMGHSRYREAYGPDVYADAVNATVERNRMLEGLQAMGRIGR